MTFRGTIYTDGFGVSIVKQNFKPGLSGRRRRFKIDDVDVPYIHQLEKETVQEIQPRAVYIDPGRRNLLYCMHNSSSLTERNVFRYTRNMKAQDTKSTQYRKPRQNTKLAEIRNANANSLLLVLHLLITTTISSTSRRRGRSYNVSLLRKFDFSKAQISLIPAQRPRGWCLGQENQDSFWSQPCIGNRRLVRPYGKIPWAYTRHRHAKNAEKEEPWSIPYWWI